MAVVDDLYVDDVRKANLERTEGETAFFEATNQADQAAISGDGCLPMQPVIGAVTNGSRVRVGAHGDGQNRPFSSLPGGWQFIFGFPLSIPGVMVVALRQKQSWADP